MLETISGLVASYGYVVLFLLVSLESLGIPVPGETALVTAAAMAALGHLSIYAVVSTAIAAAILGDNGGYWIGREGGLALVRRYGRVLHVNESHLARAHTFFERHGPKTVFIGRFIALLRTWAAVLAGAARMPYGTFMLYNALGGVCWSVVFGTLGYVFGRNLPQLEHYIGRASLAAALLVALVVALVLGWRWFERNRTPLVERTQFLWQRALRRPGLQRLKARFPGAWTFVTARFARGEYLGLHLTIGFVISLAGLWLFGSITEDVIHHDPLTRFDTALLEWLHGHASPTGYAIFHAITLLGSPVTLTVLALGVGLLLAARRQWILLGGWLAAFAAGGVLDEVLKLVIRRPRPPWPRDGLAHRLRHARLRAGSALDPSPERADLGGAGRRPADRGYRTESTLPRRPLLQRRGGWLRRRGLVALRVYLWPRGRAWVARRGTAGRNSARHPRA